MNRIKYLCGCFLLIASNANSQIHLPAEYLGKWAPDLSKCRTDPIFGESPDLMVLHRKGIRYYESNCSLTHVEISADSINVDMSCTGMGQEWQDTGLFKLSNKNQSLVMSSSSDHYTYVRCASDSK